MSYFKTRFNSKVHIFWEGHKNNFIKFWWPTQNTWTLFHPFFVIEYLISLYRLFYSMAPDNLKNRIVELVTRKHNLFLWQTKIAGLLFAGNKQSWPLELNLIFFFSLVFTATGKEHIRCTVLGVTSIKRSQWRYFMEHWH